MEDHKIIVEQEHTTVMAHYEVLPREERGYQSEAELEAEFIRQLVGQGYERVNITSEAQLLANLRRQMERLNGVTLSDKEWKQLLDGHIASPQMTIEDKTERIQRSEIVNITRDNGDSQNIKLIDKRDIHNNHLQVLNQYVPEGGKYANRYDVTILVNGLPLVADISSCILSEPIDVSRFAMLYAGAQKNIAPAGLTIVIIRDDMIGNARDITPTMLDYKIHADNGSMYNTPPTYNIYICKLVLEWIKQYGGIEAMGERNRKKAQILYDFLDSSKLFRGVAEKDARSIMNVTFVTESEELNAKFVREAEKAGFVNLKGHRSVGGMRASIYNAMSLEGVKALIAFMDKFAKEN